LKDLMKKTEEVTVHATTLTQVSVQTGSPVPNDARQQDWSETSDDDQSDQQLSLRLANVVNETTNNVMDIMATEAINASNEGRPAVGFLSDLQNAITNAEQTISTSTQSNRWIATSEEQISLNLPSSSRANGVWGSSPMRGRGRGRGRVRPTLRGHDDDFPRSILSSVTSSSSRYPQPPLIDLTVENETFTTDADGEGYFLMRDPISPASQVSAGYHNSEYFTPQSPSISGVESATQKTIPKESQQTQDAPDDLTYEEICRKIVSNSVFLVLGVKSAVTFKPNGEKADESANTRTAPKSSSLEDLLNNDYEEEDHDNLLPVASSETFRSPESRVYGGAGGRGGGNKGALLVRRFGRNVLRFVSNEVISSKREWYFDELHSAEGWTSDRKCIYTAMQQQEERAKVRIEALSQVSALLAKSKRRRDDSCPEKTNEEEQSNEMENDFLSSVHEFLLAGCYQLGLASPVSLSSKGSEASESEIRAQLSLCHHLDEVQASSIKLQSKIVDTVHEIMQWLITGLHFQASVLEGSFSSRKSERYQSDEVKLLNIFSLSCRFKANDLKLVINSGLLSVLEKFAAGNLHMVSPNSTLSKMNNDILSGLPYSHFVTVASIRLLHMIAVSTA
jgi:hypothetical protein